MRDALAGKVAIVTGGTSGIGEAVAIGFAKAGAKVAICGRRQKEGEAVVARIAEAGGEGLFLTCDVSEAASVEKFIGDTAAHFGRIDVAVNNAGIGCGDVKLADIPDEDFDNLLRINLRGVWLCMKHEIRQFLAQGRGGSIVNMGSILGHVAMGAAAHYSAGHYIAAKHGIEGLTKAACADYGAAGIRVNTLAPGIVATAISDDLIAAEVPLITRYIANTALGRLAKTEDVVGAAVFLASDASAYVTGASLAVDGGYLAQ